MSLFTNYDNLRENYIPNNRIVKIPRRRIVISDEFPHKEYNLCGEFIGFSWNYGDTPTLTLSVNPQVFVESDAIIYTAEGEAPTSSTEGTLGQKAYNTYDFKVWVCTTLDKDVYTWELQDIFTVPKQVFEEGKKITLQVFHNLEMANISVTIYNFRWESILSYTLNGSDIVDIHIDADTSSKLLKGIYYCSLKVEQGDESRVLYQYPLIIK